MGNFNLTITKRLQHQMRTLSRCAVCSVGVSKAESSQGHPPPQLIHAPERNDAYKDEILRPTAAPLAICHSPSYHSKPRKVECLCIGIHEHCIYTELEIVLWNIASSGETRAVGTRRASARMIIKVPNQPVDLLHYARTYV